MQTRNKRASDEKRRMILRSPMKQNCQINIFYSEADGGYIADFPDLDACSAFGKNLAEALKQAEVAKRAWLAAARAEGKPIPKPRCRPSIYQTRTKLPFE